jgi:hypothetical protein
MNWLRKIWKGFTEPLPPHTPTPAHAKAVPINPTAEDVSLNNFTPRAQQVLALSRKEADRLNHNFVGTEHLLLGLIALGQGTAVNVLLKMGLDLETVRGEIKGQVGTGPDQRVIGNIPYTPRVRKVLSFAAREARSMNHTYVGTEHILLGLLREGDGVAGRVLRNLEVDIEMTRQEILRELDPDFAVNYSQAKASETGAGIQSQPATALKPQAKEIDLTKRYDVYCSERQEVVVVYRNALFKGVKRLIRGDRDGVGDFYELEQADGSIVFVVRYSVIKFCAPGTTPNAENVPGKHP